MSKKTEALLDTLYGKGIEKISVIHAAFGETPHVVARVHAAWLPFVVRTHHVP